VVFCLTAKEIEEESCLLPSAKDRVHRRTREPTVSGVRSLVVEPRFKPVKGRCETLPFTDIPRTLLSAESPRFRRHETGDARFFRVPPRAVSKTVGRGFDPFCPCQRKSHPNRGGFFFGGEGSASKKITFVQTENFDLYNMLYYN